MKRGWTKEDCFVVLVNCSERSCFVLLFTRFFNSVIFSSETLLLFCPFSNFSSLLWVKFSNSFTRIFPLCGFFVVENCVHRSNLLFRIFFESLCPIVACLNLPIVFKSWIFRSSWCCFSWTILSIVLMTLSTVTRELWCLDLTWYIRNNNNQILRTTIGHNELVTTAFSVPTCSNSCCQRGCWLWMLWAQLLVEGGCVETLWAYSLHIYWEKENHQSGGR